MPLKSKKQWRKFGQMLSDHEISKKTFDEFTHSTPGGYKALPEKVKRKKK